MTGTRLQTALLCGLFVAACTTKLPTTVPRRPTNAIAAASGSPAPRLSPAPALSNSPSPLPSVATTLLSGLMQIDASYVIAAGGGNVIAAGGGNVIAAGGGNVIAAGGGNYRVLDTTASGTSAASAEATCTVASHASTVASASLDPKHVPFGTILPAAHMVVVPVSLETGKVIGPAVFTDDTGHYRVRVPEGTADNILLVAAVPGKSADDPLVANSRLRYGVILWADASKQGEIDEDTATVSSYLRLSLQQRMVHELTPDTLQTAAASDPTLVAIQFSAAEQAMLDTIAEPIRQAILVSPVVSSVEAQTAANMETLALRVSDLLISKLDLTTVMVDMQNTEWKTAAPNTLVLPTLVDFMRQVRAAAATKLAADPDYFTKQAYYQQATHHVRILKASDVCDFIVNEYFTSDFAQLDKSAPVFVDLGLACNEQDAKTRYIEPIDACAASISTSLLPKMLDPVTHQEILDDIAHFTPSSPAP